MFGDRSMKLPFCTLASMPRGVQVMGLAMVIAATLTLWESPARAQTAPPPTPALPAAAAGVPAQPERSLSQWLVRMHDASRNRAYMGTFVVSSTAGGLSSARIWHVCDGENQLEQVDSLTGPPRSTFRKNDQVVTYMHDSMVARTEVRESLRLFPGLLRTPQSSIADFYQVKQLPSERVAGFAADVLLLQAKDKLRFGYRIWSEKKSGLVIKLETLDLDGKVLEQAAYSELQLDAPVQMEKVARMMAQTQGYRVEKTELQKTTAAAEGWVLAKPVAGFNPMSCLRRAGKSADTAADKTMQWVFSDGLATVSLFVEAYDPSRHQREGQQALAATHSMTQRMGDWWLTAIGEVPPQTLKSFALGLERAK